jgi:MFS family permease
LAWIPTFFIRTHHWTSAEIGIRLGLVVMVFGTLGIYGGGRLADHLASLGKREASLFVMSLAPLASLPFCIAAPLLDDATLALACIAASVFFRAAPFGCAPAAITQVMPNAMRGQAASVYLFVVNLVGLGLGPTAVAMVTDYVFHDDQMVRYSLLIVCVTAELLAAITMRAGLKPFQRSLDRLNAYNHSHSL